MRFIRWALFLAVLGGAVARADTIHESGKHIFPQGWLQIGPIRFTDLLLPCVSGTETYCRDCLKASPCAGGGTGAFAKCEAGQWNCRDAGSGTGSVTSIDCQAGLLCTPDPIVTAGTIDFNINGLTSETALANGDLFPFLDVSVGTAPAAQRKVTLGNLREFINPSTTSTTSTTTTSTTTVTTTTSTTTTTTTTTTTSTTTTTLGSANITRTRVAWWQVSGEVKGTVDSAAGTAISITQTGVAAGAALADNTGRYDSLVNAGGAASPAGWLTTAASLRRQFLPDISWAIKTGPAATDITNVRLWMIAADASSDFAVAAPVNSFGCRYNPVDAGDTQWTVYTASAATNSAVATGVTPVVDTRYECRFVWTTINTVDAYFNGVLITTFSTTANMPPTTSPLFWQMRLVNATGVVRAYRVARVYLAEF